MFVQVNSGSHSTPQEGEGIKSTGSESRLGLITQANDSLTGIKGPYRSMSHDEAIGVMKLGAHNAS